MIYNFENLVFQGGGVLGIAYSGAIQVLEEESILPSIQRVAGTSAGAICALALALRYNSSEIQTILKDTNFESFVSEARPLEFTKMYGWFRTNPFLSWTKELIIKSGSNFHPHAEWTGDETFIDLHNKGGRDLHVFATDLNEKKSVEFSYTHTPNVIVAEAVCASMAIPAFFQAFKFSNEIPNNHIYVDGGALLNYPIMTFDSEGTNPLTLGFKFRKSEMVSTSKDLDYGSVREWVKSLVDTIADSQSEMIRRTPEYYNRTVDIDTGAVSFVDFDLSHDVKEFLIGQGREFTIQFLSEYRKSRNIFRRILSYLYPK
ncbi:patatin-like phospholipase family protein [Leptospira sp. GIMC2001]|uniref:patatin-like phospholipase family protein n=1 Tax=Leptospira sp. GIMC2001 TaxID=1513297 RepID=UPI00234B0F1F|nr:patatin-like phospholipase family protein [Leptospira sp. GIMC2001]WCL48664.1 patatin-like phospholipase family protein [Leptospira sp. GIMC2001]